MSKYAAIFLILVLIIAFIACSTTEVYYHEANVKSIAESSNEAANNSNSIIASSEISSSSSESSPSNSTDTSPLPNPSKEDYNEIIDALQRAFSTGEYQSFNEKYTYPTYAMGLGQGQVLNEWPTSLVGVIAKMDYDLTNAVFNSETTSCSIKVALKVLSGNNNIPIGNQTMQINIELASDGNEQAIALRSMMLTTDGQIYAGEENGYSPFEKQVLRVTEEMEYIASKPLSRIMSFIDIFEHNLLDANSNVQFYTTDEIIAGAKKYLGIDFSIAGYPHDEEIVGFEDGKYYALGFGPPMRYFSTCILDEPTEGDVTCRVFVYTDEFLLIVSEIKDYNYLILLDENGSPYAKLLSVL